MQKPKTLTRQALPLLAALTANAAAQAFLLVVLPALGRDLSFDPLQTGALLGSAALFLIIFAPIWGKLSEKTGRKPVLLIGLAAASAAPVLMALIIALRLEKALSPLAALVMLFIIRGAQSLFSAGLMPAAQAWMADCTSPENRSKAMGMLGASYGVGGILGAAIAFLIGGSHPVAALIALAVFVFAGLCLVYTKLTDQQPIADTKTTPLDRLDMAAILPGLVITFIGVSIYAIMQHVTALRLEDRMAFSRPDAISTAGAALMGAAITMALAQTLGISRLKRSAQQLMLIGATLGTVSLTGVVVAASPALLLGSLFAMGGALGILLPGNLTFMSIKAGVGAQGRAAGINAVSQGMAMSIGPFAGAALHRISPLAPSFVCLIAMLVAVFICLGLRGKS